MICGMEKGRRIWIITGVIIAAGFIAGLWYYRPPEGKTTLLVYSGAGLKSAMDELEQGFEKIYPDVDVVISYGGSGQIFGQFSTSKRGDIFIPGSEYYTKQGIAQGLVYEEMTKSITYHIPVILVRKGNSEDITSLKDLAMPGLKIALGDVRQSAIGRLSKEILERQGLYEDIKNNNLVVTTATVNELFIYVGIGKVDATIVWEDNVGILAGQGKVDVVEIDPVNNIIKTIPVSVCKCTKHLGLAKEFMNFVCSKEGLNIWKENGFKPYAG